jgi:DNA repair exonuclease SbcCD ATPase subunit
MELNVQGIQRLIKEIESALKPEIEKIIGDVVNVQHGVESSRKLLEVIRAARVEGKTIDEISAAMKLNDSIIAAIDALNQNLARLNQSKESMARILASKEEDKKQSQKGLVNSIKRLFGPDQSIELAIDSAQEQLNALQTQIAEIQTELEAKAAERNQNLESGPLLILRSIDATEQSFSENIVSTAKASLELIEGATKSIQILLQRTAYSEATAREINESIAEAEVRQTILKGAIQQVAKNTTLQTQKLKVDLDAKDAEIAQTDKGDVQAAVLNAARVDIDQHYNGALDYQEVLNQTETNFEVIAAGNVEAKSRANQLAALIHTEKELLKRLGTEALPATTLALRTVLETSVAQQNSELAVTIGAITERARETGKEGLSNLINAQAELHAQKIKDMDRAIKALADAEEAVVQRIEATVNEGTETRERMKTLVDVASGLQDALGELNEIRPSVASNPDQQ